jgi:hypothetical protein
MVHVPPAAPVWIQTVDATGPKIAGGTDGSPIGETTPSHGFENDAAIGRSVTATERCGGSAIVKRS